VVYLANHETGAAKLFQAGNAASAPRNVMA
jgi:hypothetical protein